MFGWDVEPGVALPNRSGWFRFASSKFKPAMAAPTHFPFIEKPVRMMPSLTSGYAAASSYVRAEPKE